MKIYITKYALTDGIQVIDSATIDRDRCAVANENRAYSFYPGEFYADLEPAQRKAYIMRDKKIHRLKKQIESLSKLNFEHVSKMEF